MKRKTKRVTFRLNVDDFLLLRIIREIYSVNISSLLREFIKQYAKEKRIG